MLGLYDVRHAITTLVLTAIVSLGADAAPQREKFRLRATVLDVVTMPSPVIAGLPRDYMLVDFDAGFAVAMRVQSIIPPLANFTGGSTVTFAIHSPSALFGAENPKGKTYDFTLRRPQAGEKIPTWNLEVR